MLTYFFTQDKAWSNKTCWNNLSTEFRVVRRHMNTNTVTQSNFSCQDLTQCRHHQVKPQAPKTFFDQGQTLPTLTG